MTQDILDHEFHDTLSATAKQLTHSTELPLPIRMAALELDIAATQMGIVLREHALRRPDKPCPPSPVMATADTPPGLLEYEAS